MTIAPGGKEQREFTVGARSTWKQRGKGIDLLSQEPDLADR